MEIYLSPIYITDFHFGLIIQNYRNTYLGTAAGPKKAKQPTRSMYMDNVKGNKGGKAAGGGKPMVSNYVPPSKRSARPTGLYQPPQGQYSSKIKNPIVWND